MSTNLSYLFRRRPQRYEWNERLPDGTEAISVGLPEILRMPGEGQGVALAEAPAPFPVVPQRIYSAPDWSSDPATPPIAAAPEAAPVMRPRRVFTPPDWNAEPQPLPDAQGRERIADPRAFMTNRINDVISHPTQQNSNSRLGGGLRAGGRVGLRVLRETGNPMAALGATISGGLYGLFNKSYDEQLGEEESAGRMQGRLAQMDAREAAALNLAQERAGLKKTQAETQKLLNPEPKTFQGGDGLQYRINPDGTASAIPGQGRKAVAAKVLRTVNRGGKVWYETEDGLKPALDPESGEQLKEELIDYQINGHTYKVTPQKAAEFDAQIEAANIGAGAKAGEYQTEADNANVTREYEIQKQQIDRDNQAAERRYADASKAVEELRAAVKEAQKASADANNPAKEGDRAYNRQLFDTAMQRVRALAATVKRNYGELVEDDPDTRWPIVLKGRPDAKPYPTPPRVQAKPTPAKRTGGPAPAPPISEADFLAHAKEKMGAAFDEAKARAAYRKRYGR